MGTTKSVNSRPDSRSKETRRAAEATARAVVDAAADGPIVLTAAGCIGIVWRDGHGWQSQVHGARAKPAMLTRTAFGGDPTVEEALTATARAVAQMSWSPDLADDEAHFHAVLDTLCQPRSLTEPVRQSLVRWALWQRLVRLATAAGQGPSQAAELAWEQERAGHDRVAFVIAAWLPATDDSAYLDAAARLLTAEEQTAAAAAIAAKRAAA